MRSSREKSSLGGGKAGWVKHAVVDVFDFVIPPIIPAVILRKDDMIQDSASLFAINPHEDLGLWQTGFDIKMVTMQRHTAILIRGAGKQCLGKRAREFVGRVQAPLGVAQDPQGDGGRKPFLH